MRLAQQFIWYAAMGAIGTLAQYSILVALVELMRTDALTASTLGFVVGAFVNYFLNYRYTFRSSNSHHRTLTRFMTVALLGLGLNSVVMATTTRIANINYLAGQVVATGIVLVTTFLTNRGWTFRERTNGRTR